MRSGARNGIDWNCRNLPTYRPRNIYPFGMLHRFKEWVGEMESKGKTDNGYLACPLNIIPVIELFWLLKVNIYQKSAERIYNSNYVNVASDSIVWHTQNMRGAMGFCGTFCSKWMCWTALFDRMKCNGNEVNVCEVHALILKLKVWQNRLAALPVRKESQRKKNGRNRCLFHLNFV